MQMTYAEQAEKFSRMKWEHPKGPADSAAVLCSIRRWQRIEMDWRTLLLVPKGMTLHGFKRTK